MQNVLLKNIGLINYEEGWKLQQKIFDSLLQKKQAEREGLVSDPCRPESSVQTLILCEHPHVYTLGRSGHKENMLIDDKFLRKIGADFYKIDRGGDVTYHGPGQLVGYPIIDLERLDIGLKEYVCLLEQSVIDTLAEFGIEGTRSAGATGVWLRSDSKGGERKICAIGVRSSRFVTMHGFALNVSPAMEYFSYINPCGFVDKGVTSMSLELGEKVDMERVKKIYAQKFAGVFNVRITISG